MHGGGQEGATLAWHSCMASSEMCTIKYKYYINKIRGIA